MSRYSQRQSSIRKISTWCWCPYVWHTRREGDVRAAAETAGLLYKQFRSVIIWERFAIPREKRKQSCLRDWFVALVQCSFKTPGYKVSPCLIKGFTVGRGLMYYQDMSWRRDTAWDSSNTQTVKDKRIYGSADKRDHWNTTTPQQLQQRWRIHAQLSLATLAQAVKLIKLNTSYIQSCLKPRRKPVSVSEILVIVTVSVNEASDVVTRRNG